MCRLITNRRLIVPWLMLGVMCLFAICATADEHVRDDRSRAGAVLVEARREAVLGSNESRAIDGRLIQRWMSLASKCNLAEQRLFLEPFSDAERRMMDKVQSLAPPIVHRTHLDSLRQILAHGALIAPREADRRGDAPSKITTPVVEELLFGGRDCIFATVGPPDGTPRYGSVIVRFKPTVCQTAWATPASGDHFLDNMRFKNTVRLNQLLGTTNRPPDELPPQAGVDFDDRLHFSHRVVAGADLQTALALQAVMKIRQKNPNDESIVSRWKALLAEEDSRRFWSLFCDDRAGVAIHDREPFGYLEAKFPQEVPIAQVEAIELEPEDFDPVSKWPEAERWRDLIRLQETAPPMSTP